MNLHQLVLISIEYKDENNVDRSNIGTGYFITPHLIMTSNHVLPAKPLEICISFLSFNTF